VPAVPEARISIGLRWRDMDMLGHLNQAVYHELLEEGRSALFESLGDRGRFPFVVVRVELDYKREVRRDHGTVDVTARVDRVGRTSCVLGQEIIRSDGVVAAEGSTVIVAWDMQARSARELTADERELLEAR
jgi:acyl-CoA thioester hydrolase